MYRCTLLSAASRKMHRNAVIGICCLAFSVIANRLGEPQTYGHYQTPGTCHFYPSFVSQLLLCPVPWTFVPNPLIIVENISNAKIHGVKRTKTASMRIPTWHEVSNCSGCAGALPVPGDDHWLYGPGGTYGHASFCHVRKRWI